MTWRVFVIPYVVDANGRRPAYVTALGCPWSAMGYGRIDWALVAADVDDAQHASLVANADVQAFPEYLDAPVGAGRLAATKEALETIRVPAEWVTAATTFRLIARTVGGLFQFAQRYGSLTGGEELTPSRAALDLRFNQLTQARRDNLAATAASLGLDVSEIVGTTLIRRALKVCAEQWGARPLVFSPSFAV